MDKAHPWKYIDPDGKKPSRKGMLLSNEIKMFCDHKLLIAERFEPGNLRPAAYTLRIGSDYADSRGRLGRLSDENPHLIMEPNSIVYVSTFEKLDLPFYVAARFNLRVKWVYKGILLGTGPQVEPGYRGFLSCPLYNLTDRPIRITHKEDFATIDFERTTDFCPTANQEDAEAIASAVTKGDELDQLKWGGQDYLLFKQKEYPPLKLLPGYDVISSLFELSNEVKTWRHIGIGFAISFFALTLTLLGFGGNIQRQLNELSGQAQQSQAAERIADKESKQIQEELKALKERMATIEKENALRKDSRATSSKKR